MDVEVLVSCMNQKDYSIIDNLGLETDAVIINQSKLNSYTDKVIDNYKNIKFVCSNQKGLTKSRNLALTYASKEICIFCDDDVVYTKNYKEAILKAFEELPEADIIIFDIERINHNRFIKPISKIRKAPRYKSYGSVRIAFRRRKIQENNIWFDINFGSGSIYSSGEETIFLNDAHKKKLNIYEYPAIIAKVDFKDSTWREGYNEKFFYDKGALLAAAYPMFKYLFIFYYVFSLRKFTSLTITNIIKWMVRGINGYKRLIPYDSYINLHR